MTFIYATIAILGIAGMGLYNRYILKSVSAHSFALLTNLIPAIIFVPIALSNWNYTNSKEAWIAILVASVLWALSSLLYSISSKTTEASIRAPLSQSKLLWALLFGLVILGEVISWQHALAVFVLFAGISILLWHPERKFGSLKDPGVRWTLGSAILSAAVAVADKYALGFFSVEMYGLLAYIFPGTILFLFTPRKGEDVAHLWKTSRIHVLLFSIVSVVTYYAMLKTYSLLPISIAYPLLQISTLITVIGGILLFRERENMLQKAIAVVLVIIGSVLLKLA